MRYMVIRSEGLSKIAGRRRLVEDLSFEVEPGEIYGLLGPQGAGKSTILELILNVQHPSSGRAIVLGMDSRSQGQVIRQQVGYQPRRLILPTRHSAERYLSDLCIKRGKALDEATLQSAERFGLDLKRVIGSLNASEKQILGILQAFMHQRELILLDEPTRHLSEAALYTFYHLVSETRHDGRSVVFTSTSLPEVERVCDRTAVLHAGRLLAVERGVHLRSRAIRKIEMRFAQPVTAQSFVGIPNLSQLQVDDNFLRCIVCGDTDPLIKTASQFKVIDVISQTPSLEESFKSYYGLSVAG
ncbi:MAG: ABC transporter ATP-binding protein [Anaerolineae bacterium]|nr:ABC transporter ATP-binding protein [Anaerolineae bacterium]